MLFNQVDDTGSIIQEQNVHIVSSLRFTVGEMGWKQLMRYLQLDLKHSNVVCITACMLRSD